MSRVSSRNDFVRIIVSVIVSVLSRVTIETEAGMTNCGQCWGQVKSAHYKYKYNTSKNLYSAVIHKKNESEALFGPLGGKQVSFKFWFKSTVVNRGSNASRKTVPNSGCCYSKRTRRSYSVSSRLLK